MSAASQPALALSASGERFRIALRSPTGQVHELDCAGTRQSAEATALLDRLLVSASVARQEIREIRVDRGPGSYTGLRMALTFARVWAAFTGIPMRASTSLELLALAAWRRHGVDAARTIRPMLDARRERAHTARLALTAGSVVWLEPAQAIPIAACAPMIASEDALLLAPSLVAAFANPPQALPLPTLRAADLFDTALASELIAADALEPLYLMGSYAE